MVRRRRIPLAVLLGCLGAAIAGAGRAEPLALDGAQLDRVVAAGEVSGFDYGFRGGSTQITTQISMPVSSSAVAVCLFCTGDASAVAVANAVGVAQADALAVSTGGGQTYALSNALGPYIMLLAPPPAASAAHEPARGKGAGRRP